MNNLNPKVTPYFTNGCGRCSLFNTPECKVHNWTDELQKLRNIAIDSGLNEELKWSVPVYTFEGKNIFVVAAFKEYCSISFFKGVLLKDEHKILTKQGENSQSGRLIKFTNVRGIIDLESVIKDYILEAVEIEKSGVKVEYKQVSDYEIPIELQDKFEQDADFQTAFFALTSGRQKGYILHFSQPKQSKTRVERIEKSMQNILIGKGLHDDYKTKK
ncbi:MAG: DUF1801 domain-containing protein [Pyrinomonadaceae bacterium]|jgi:uncharacterized protein YdeI (YjbR/CyaY-like superfamily)|nr:DUF1801 domain-containing protein [Pyrinomonadaceae bacterium]